MHGWNASCQVKLRPTLFRSNLFTDNFHPTKLKFSTLTAGQAYILCEFSFIIIGVPRMYSVTNCTALSVQRTSHEFNREPAALPVKTFVIIRIRHERNLKLIVYPRNMFGIEIPRVVRGWYLQKTLVNDPWVSLKKIGTNSGQFWKMALVNYDIRYL